MTEQAPDWLVAYREGRTAPAALAQPPLQPQAAPSQGGKGGKAARHIVFFEHDNTRFGRPSPAPAQATYFDHLAPAG